MHCVLRNLRIGFAALIGLWFGGAHAQASPSAYTWATRYDWTGKVTGTIAPDPDGAGSLHYAAVRNTYDAGGRLIQVEKGELASWQAETIAPSAWSGFTVLQTLQTSYDVLNRKLTDKTISAGTTYTLTQYSYDAAGRLECTAVRMNSAVYGSLPASACTPSTQGSNGPDQITRNVYNDAGELVQAREGVGAGIEKADATYSYTANGKKEYLIDGEGNRARFVYDGQDRLYQWQFPSTTRPSAYDNSSQGNALSTAGSVNTSDYEQYGYDNNGNRTTLRKRDGRTIGYTYDALNRVTLKDLPSTPTDVGYTYDLLGHQLAVTFTDTGLGVTNTYDGFGELSSSTTNVGGTNRTMSYLYDSDGDRYRVTHPDGIYFTTGFDGLDRAASESWTTASGTTQFMGITFDGAGRRSILGRPNSATGYGYDGISRLTSQCQVFSGGSCWVASSAGLNETLTYSPASQITSQSRDNDDYAWTGTALVNRNYTTNGLNQYSAAGSASFTYDANGNLTSDGTNTYSYDVENRLISVTGGRTANLTYDPLGRLASVNQGSSATRSRFLYDGDELAIEYDDAGNIKTRFMFGGEDEPIVSDPGGALACTNGTRFLHADHQGSIVALADCSGNRQAVNAYDEYGIPGSANTGRFQYTGQMWMPEIGMYYYKARMYSPTLGRFMQTDPIGYKDQINLYEYVADDPVNRTDPTGQVVVVSGSADDRELLKSAIRSVANADPSLRSRVMTLMSSEFRHRIVFGDPGAGFAAATTPFIPANASNGQGTDTTITILPFYRAGTDSLNRDLKTMIAHELTGHAYDDDAGKANQAVNPLTGIRMTEHSAMNAENKFNRAVGRPEAKKYGEKLLDPPTGTRIRLPKE